MNDKIITRYIDVGVYRSKLDLVKAITRTGESEMDAATAMAVEYHAKELIAGRPVYAKVWDSERRPTSEYAITAQLITEAVKLGGGQQELFREAANES